MSRSDSRVLIIGADGLRPDLFDPALMPNVARLKAAGTWFGNHHSAYPSHTRVNATTLATGSSPGRHGIVANTMLVPDVTDDHIIDTSQYKHLDAIQSASGATVLVPSLSDALQARGERLAVAGTGSPGSNVLWTFNHRGRIVNPNSALGIADLYDLREKLGEVPIGAGFTSADRNIYATRAVTELYLHDPENRVITLWLAEPDSALHTFGLGSPESIASLQSVDACVGMVLGEMDRLGIRDQFDIFFISDHGHSTVIAHKTLREFLLDARKDLGSSLPPLATASDFIYAMPGTPEPTSDDLAPLVDWLDAQPWVDVIAGGVPGTEFLPGVIPLAELWQGHLTARRPLLAVSPAWNDTRNAFGVPGEVAALTTQAALKSSHGSLSPFNMHATFVASGPRFSEGVSSDLPTGAIDLTPTILSLLGMPIPESVDGRVLTEALENYDQPDLQATRQPLAPANPGSRNRNVILERVGRTSYVHGSAQHGETRPIEA